MSKGKFKTLTLNEVDENSKRNKHKRVEQIVLRPFWPETLGSFGSLFFHQIIMSFALAGIQFEVKT
ncbi:CLUMA_CG002943, isoform A [Clunio marinus]|uniref:CLUMA_CG002943, isoform A n=1 Tax=Clunio marinus TaxID=568069 RepID=A0A1J1HRS9_9DIPT|nr:CLUMA_CG002943, isoform A [Clunio marinus]